MVECVQEAIEHVIELVTKERQIGINNLGSWDEVDWLKHEIITNRILYRQKSLNPQLDASVIQNLVNIEFVNSGKCRNIMYIVSEDIYKPNTCFLVGLSADGKPAVVSTYRFSKNAVKDSIDQMRGNDKLEEFISGCELAGKDPVEVLRFECIKTVVMHELGHILGLLPETETENLVNGIGADHCANNCVMGPGMTVPRDWIKYTLNRIESTAYCPRCLGLLRTYKL
jgi:predicted Zn-dependent protease